MVDSDDAHNVEDKSTVGDMCVNNPDIGDNDGCGNGGVMYGVIVVITVILV